MITGHDFIQLSNRWSMLTNEGEAVWRTATSRAYYGAFHVARAFVHDTLGIVDLGSRENQHRFVREALAHSGDTSAVTAASILTALHEHRKDADYELARSDHAKIKIAKATFLLADKVQNLIAVCSVPANYPAMKASILGWMRAVRKIP